MVVHVAKVEGDGAGYDIKSYTSDGEQKFIEVKTTRGASRPLSTSAQLRRASQVNMVTITTFIASLSSMRQRARESSS